MIKTIVCAIMFVFGLYCIIKPNNFLTPRIMFNEYGNTIIQKKYGNKTAQKWVRWAGIVAVFFSIFFYFYLKFN